MSTSLTATSSTTLLSANPSTTDTVAASTRRKTACGPRVIEFSTDGVTRFVILTKHYAFKIPNFRYGWRLFITGLLCNMHEVMFGTLQLPECCPILWSLPGGWLVCMRRAKPLTEQDWQQFDYNGFVRKPDCLIPAENKSDSFGWLDGKIVAVDYG